MTLAPTPMQTVAVGIGSTTTRMAAARLGRIESLSPAGDVHLAVPSAVGLASDGGLVAGTVAAELELLAPERTERSPLAHVGETELLLGDRPVRLAEVVAGLLDWAVEELRLALPAARAEAVEYRLVYPAEWGPARTEPLAAAAALAGLEPFRLVPAPVAAADHVARTFVREGELVVVYDLGAERFDVAVLRRTEAGFELAGPPGGRQPLGGDDVDRALVDLLGAGPAGRHADWALLCGPPDAEWRRQAARLMGEVRRAKATLCTQVATEIEVLGTEVQLTKAEVDEVATPVVEASLAALEETLGVCGVAVSELAAVVMVGGTSRMPIVADALWRRLGVRPSVVEEPAAAAVLGAAAALGVSAPTRAAGGAVGPSGAAPAAAGDSAAAASSSSVWSAQATGSVSVKSRGRRFRSQLSASPTTALWSKGADCFGYLDITGEGVAVHVSDEPARGPDVATCAAEAAERLAAEVPGFEDGGVAPTAAFGDAGALERRYRWTGPAGSSESSFERYVAVGGRWIVLGAPERARELVNTVELDGPGTTPGVRFSLAVTAVVPDGWTVTDRVDVVRHGTRQRATADSCSLPPGVTDADFVGQQIGVLDQGAGLARQEVAPGSFLGRRPATTVTYRRNADGGAPQILRVWLGVIDGRGYRVTVSLPESDKGLAIMPNHNLLAGHLVLRDHVSVIPQLGSLPSIDSVKRFFKR